jgi:hypothetical protein
MFAVSVWKPSGDGPSKAHAANAPLSHRLDSTAAKPVRLTKPHAGDQIPTRHRGIKDSPPYLHDGRLLTLEDTVEFFNLVLGLKLTQDEKSALVAYMRQL